MDDEAWDKTVEDVGESVVSYPSNNIQVIRVISEVDRNLLCDLLRYIDFDNLATDDESLKKRAKVNDLERDGE